MKTFCSLRQVISFCDKKIDVAAINVAFESQLKSKANELKMERCFFWVVFSSLQFANMLERRVFFYIYEQLSCKWKSDEFESEWKKKRINLIRKKNEYRKYIWNGTQEKMEISINKMNWMQINGILEWICRKHAADVFSVARMYLALMAGSPSDPRGKTDFIWCVYGAAKEELTSAWVTDCPNWCRDCDHVGQCWSFRLHAHCTTAHTISTEFISFASNKMCRNWIAKWNFAREKDDNKYDKKHKWILN